MNINIWQPRWIRRKDKPVARLRQGSIQRHCLIALVSPEFNNLRIVQKFVGVVRTNSRKQNLAFKSQDITRVLYGIVVNHWVSYETLEVDTLIWQGQIPCRYEIHMRRGLAYILAPRLYIRCPGNGSRIALQTMRSVTEKRGRRFCLPV